MFVAPDPVLDLAQTRVSPPGRLGETLHPGVAEAKRRGGFQHFRSEVLDIAIALPTGRPLLKSRDPVEIFFDQGRRGCESLLHLLELPLSRFPPRHQFLRGEAAVGKRRAPAQHFPHGLRGREHQGLPAPPSGGQASRETHLFRGIEQRPVV